MKSLHPVGHQDIHVIFTIAPPTISEIEAYINKYEGKGNRLTLDLTIPAVRSQILQFKPKTWVVKMRAPPPMKPADHIGMSLFLFRSLFD
jgi:hypothetical protein